MAVLRAADILSPADMCLGLRGDFWSRGLSFEDTMHFCPESIRWQNSEGFAFSVQV